MKPIPLFLQKADIGGKRGYSQQNMGYKPMI
jgi:hypothetical protein